MPFRNLQSFLSFLEKKGDLQRIRAEVDPVLEITEIATRVVRAQGPALLFENVKGSRFPLLINVLGAERRVTWALGRPAAEAGSELARLADGLMPPSPARLWSERAALRRVLAMKPKNISKPPVLRNRIEPVDLAALPIAQSWPGDGGKFITFPLVVTKSPHDGKQNMGVYRMHVYGRDQTGMHWQIAKGGGYHYTQAEAQGESLPLVTVLGADPILMMCGILPLPEGLSEISFAGFLRGESTRVTSVGSGRLAVPAESEFLLEGFVPPQERRMEGPYGDHFGHYSLAAPFPVFHVEKIWHRDQAVFPIAVVGKPPQEDQVIGDAVQELLLPLLKIMHPEISDMWAYQEAGFHNLLVIGVRQRFAKEAIKTGLWALGEGQLALSKCVILVDPDVNVRRFPDVLKAIRENFSPAEDFLLLPGTSQDTLDFTSYKMNLGSKMILDATRTERRSTHSVNVDAVRGIDPRITEVHLVDGTLLAVQVKTGANGRTEGTSRHYAHSGAGREILEKMLSLPALPPIVAAVSGDIPLKHEVLLLWGLFTRFDCARDTFFQKVELKGGHPVYGGPLFIDATWKPGYPDPLEMAESVVKTVDRRWSEYGFKQELPHSY